ncbi:MAG: nitroreductase family deazaflavin-dependent oxidoreductase [Chloroflexi bacterium]|nr:nitroreductase family deazaflavin-dependent oxidoreductase [Chloroflexota bacterium]
MAQPSKNIFTEFSARFSKFTPYRLHRLLYKLTGGAFGNKMPGGNLNVLLLTSTGRKSGIQRTHPLMYYQDGADFVIVASNSGADKPPLWYLNLKSCPEATVQVRDMTEAVVAREASEEERARLWLILTKEQPIFKSYETFTDRTMPVIILHPR